MAWRGTTKNDDLVSIDAEHAWWAQRGDDDLKVKRWGYRPKPEVEAPQVTWNAVGEPAGSMPSDSAPLFDPDELFDAVRGTGLTGGGFHGSSADAGWGIDPLVGYGRFGAFDDAELLEPIALGPRQLSFDDVELSEPSGQVPRQLSFDDLELSEPSGQEPQQLSFDDVEVVEATGAGGGGDDASARLRESFRSLAARLVGAPASEPAADDDAVTEAELADADAELAAAELADAELAAAELADVAAELADAELADAELADADAAAELADADAELAELVIDLRDTVDDDGDWVLSGLRTDAWFLSR